jgi:hypothetical protein
MKKTFRFISLIALYIIGYQHFSCFAQYSLKVDTSQVYQEITNPTYEIPDNSQYFGNVTTKPDMYFKAFGVQFDLYDNVFIPIKEGYCYFANGSRSATLYACKGDYTKRPGQTSIFSFKTDTTGGNKTFIMQWKNMGFLNGHDTDYINFQIWLYGSDGRIQFRFGPNKVRKGLYENGANGPTIGLLEMDDAFSTIYTQLWLKGYPSKPLVVNTNGIVNLDKTPSSGTVYTFSFGLSGINLVNSGREFSVYPNPAIDKLQLCYKENISISSVSIINSTGQELMTFTNASDWESINVSGLDPGVYFVQVRDKNGMVSTRKFMR